MCCRLIPPDLLRHDATIPEEAIQDLRAGEVPAGQLGAVNDLLDRVVRSDGRRSWSAVPPKEIVDGEEDADPGNH